MTDMLKSKKGFTLVELCIVIALMGVVVAMVVGFIGQYNKDTYSLMKNRNVMNDINAVRQMTSDWLRYYDNGKYEIAPSDAEHGSSVLQAKETATGAVDKLEIRDGYILWEKSGVEYQKRTFELINEGKFTFTAENKNGEKPVIRCRVKFNEGRNWHDMLFSIMTKTPRSRFSPAEA